MLLPRISKLIYFQGTGETIRNIDHLLADMYWSFDNWICILRYHAFCCAREAINLNVTVPWISYCRQTSNRNRTLVSNKIVDHSDVIGAPPALPLHLHSQLDTCLQWIDIDNCKTHLSFGFGALYIIGFSVNTNTNAAYSGHCLWFQLSKSIQYREMVKM